MSEQKRLLPKSLAWRLTLLGAVGFLVLLAASAVVLRDQIHQTLLDPGIPFQTYEPPPAPDYAAAEAWAAHQDGALDEAGETPAVFFVHPTTYDGGQHWNARFDRRQEGEELDRFVLPNWAAPFAAGDAALFAPHYRQASLYAFMNNREDSLQARRLAYTDIRAAFESFVAEAGEDRPILIAGVGQGALHALGLLIDVVAPDETLRKRLASAYLLEAPVPLDLFSGPLATLQPCAGPNDVRCVVSYNAVRPVERERIENILDRSMSWTASGALDYVSDRALLCINPLIWTSSEDYAPARLHRGGAAAEGLSLEDAPSPMANQTGAQCQNGLLMIEQPRARALRRPGRLGEDRRTPVSNLFYMDLRLDAARRLEALETIRDDEARFAPPLDAPVEIGGTEFKPIDG
ncbi:MAG: DUF3089 domain-containing protein [Oceanicaulis sp.]